MMINRRETLRYLGIQGQQADDKTLQLVEEVERELSQSIQQKSIYREYPCSVSGHTVHLGGLLIVSADLAKNLKGCSYAVLLAATVGRAADFMIRKYSVTNLAKAAVVQAAGASCIEAYVDQIERDIQKDAGKRGLYLRPRFSPGYGDFALECQKGIFAVLECSKRIGLTLTEGNLMMPSKSVTAVIGLTKDAKRSCYQHSCAQCEMEECGFRETVTAAPTDGAPTC
ncbi:Vitamin B12 dependent methionine synthase activation subunit [Lachnospiraceae bacterium 29-84]